MGLGGSDLAVLGGKKETAFFFEKKKQKTFASFLQKRTCLLF
jgi:hypothetical protein